MRLTPQMVADACGISLRYLHQIFEGEGITVSTYVRTQRLAMCDAMLRDPQCRKSLSEIAYHWGFGDQAQFQPQLTAAASAARQVRRGPHRGRHAPNASRLLLEHTLGRRRSSASCSLAQIFLR